MDQFEKHLMVTIHCCCLVYSAISLYILTKGKDNENKTK